MSRIEGPEPRISIPSNLVAGSFELTEPPGDPPPSAFREPSEQALSDDLVEPIANLIEAASLILRRCRRRDQEGEGKKGGKAKEGVPGGGYELDHVTISGDVSRSWLDAAKLPKKRELAWNTAIAVLETVMKTLKDKSVLQAIEDQLAADSKKHGKEIKAKIHVEIQEDDYWKGFELAGVTFGGDPITVYINLDTLANLKVEEARAAVIQELLHAKANAYLDAGLPSPYPKGHDDPEFKKREEELKKKAEK